MPSIIFIYRARWIILFKFFILIICHLWDSCGVWSAAAVWSARVRPPQSIRPTPAPAPPAAPAGRARGRPGGRHCSATWSVCCRGTSPGPAAAHRSQSNHTAPSADPNFERGLLRFGVPNMYTLGINLEPLRLNQCCGSMTFRYGSGSAPLTNGSRSDSGGILLFSSETFKKSTKKFFLSKFCCLLLLFEATLTSFSEDKKSQRCHKKLGSRFFLLYLLRKRGSNRVRICVTSSSQVQLGGCRCSVWERIFGLDDFLQKVNFTAS